MQGELFEKNCDVLKFLLSNHDKMKKDELTLSSRRFLFITSIALLNREADKKNERLSIAEEKMENSQKNNNLITAKLRKKKII